MEIKTHQTGRGPIPTLTSLMGLGDESKRDDLMYGDFSGVVTAVDMV